MIRVGSGQKYDPNSPIVDVMLDTIIKQRMENPLNEANVRYKYNAIIIIFKFWNYLAWLFN